jgi:(hydroxyamino)benzene mutase
LSTNSHQRRAGHRLVQLGVVLFLLGLFVGFAVPFLTNPRMGLTSHLEGVMNGMLLIILGLVWPRLTLGEGALKAAFWMTIYASFANFAATFLAAVWGAGRNMPIAAPEPTATVMQENVVDFLLVTLAAALVAAMVIVLWGLRGLPEAPVPPGIPLPDEIRRPRAEPRADAGVG